MKIGNIIIAVLAALVLVVMLSLVGVTVAPLAFLVFGIPIALFAYLLILAKRYLDTKSQESEISTDLNAKIILLSESLDRIEKKIDRIDRILEKVSE